MGGGRKRQAYEARHTQKKKKKRKGKKTKKQPAKVRKRDGEREGIREVFEMKVELKRPHFLGFLE